MKKIDLYDYFEIKKKNHSIGKLEYFDGVGNTSVIICPGGGYSFLSDTEKYNVAEKYIEYGYKTYILHYSISPVHFPYQYLEIAAAIDYVKREDKGNKVIVVGFSAGGHLAAMSATLFNKPIAKDAFYLTRRFPWNVNFLRPDGVILCYPVISYDKKLRHSGSFRCLCGRNKKLKRVLSIEKLVDAETPPIFMWHTKADKGVPYGNSLLMKERLDAVGVKNELVLFELGGHGLNLGNDEYPEVRAWLAKSVDFINSL